MVTVDLIERLRYEGESDALDFKSEQYRFIGASDEDKSELLKDVLAFANSWRRTDAYILIGFRDVKGGQAEVTGLSAHMDDAQLQQFVNSKTQRPIRMSYYGFRLEDKDVAVIHIPLQERPFFLLRRFGKLEPNVVYVRRGSSTAQATPDEIARMGRAESTIGDIDLDVFFADFSSRTRAEPDVRSRVLDLTTIGSVPDYRLRRPNPYGVNPGRWANAGYYRELVKYTKVTQLVAPVWLAIRNGGASTAADVRLEVSVPGRSGEVLVLDEQDYPDPPRAEYDMMNMSIPEAATHFRPQLVVEPVGDDWLISGRLEKVQPRATEWFRDPVYVGAANTMVLQLRVTVFSDNLPSPHNQRLDLPIHAKHEQPDLDRILQLEEHRLASSAEHRALLDRIAEESGEP